MTEKTFEAGRHLTNLRGRDYLEVKWRLVWLRNDHPDASVETELIKHTEPTQRGEPGVAIFRARVAIPGAGEASGWGSETSSDFREYIEKAETKALGRALAALGYGTQFCEDFSFNDEANGRGRQVDNAKSRPPQTASEPQLRAIFGLAGDKLGQDSKAAEAAIAERFGKPAAELSRKEASELITELRGLPAAAQAAAA